MLQQRALEITDFSGGITDEFIGTDPTLHQRATNFFITPFKKLKTRSGSELDVSVSEARAKVVGSTRIDLLMPSLDSGTESLLHKVSVGKFFYDSGSAIAELVGPGSASLFPASCYVTQARWNSHVFLAGMTAAGTYYKPQKVYAKGSAEAVPILRLRTAGLPALASTPTITGGAGAYRYAFLHSYTYIVGGRTFLDRGPLTQTASAVGGSGAAISAIPVLANGSGDHYDTTVIKVEIYRTTNGGQTYYKLGEVTNGTTTFNDTTADGTLDDAATIYTDGGIAENNPPPKSKVVHISELGFAYYGNCVDPTSNELVANRVYQSKPNDPDSVPILFFEDLDDEVVAITSFKGIPVVLGKQNVYRIDGRFDQFGLGAMVPKKIADFVGGISALAVAQTPEGIFFAGTNGFYWTDGYRVLKISNGFNDTYQEKIGDRSSAAKALVSMAYDEKDRRLWCSFQDDDGSTENDACFVLHLEFGIRPKSSFTTIGGSGFEASHLCFHQGKMYRGHSDGYTFRHSDSISRDPRVNAAVNVSTWGTQAIRYDYRSVYLDFGTRAIRKWTASWLATLKINSDISVQPSTDRDNQQSPRESREIRVTSDFDWGDENVVWGDTVIYDTGEGLVERMIRMPAQGLRCSYRQYRLANSYTLIARSDDFGGAGTVASNVLTVAAETLPSDLLDYFICFAADDYVLQYPITASTGTTVTFTNTGSTAPSGSAEWEIRGYAKGHLCEVLSLVANYAPLTPSQTPYQAGEEGSNGT